MSEVFYSATLGWDQLWWLSMKHSKIIWCSVAQHFSVKWILKSYSVRNNEWPFLEFFFSFSGYSEYFFFFLWKSLKNIFRIRGIHSCTPPFHHWRGMNWWNENIVLKQIDALNQCIVGCGSCALKMRKQVRKVFLHIFSFALVWNEKFSENYFIAGPLIHEILVNDLEEVLCRINLLRKFIQPKKKTKKKILKLFNRF